MSTRRQKQQQRQFQVLALLSKRLIVVNHWRGQISPVITQNVQRIECAEVKANPMLQNQKGGLIPISLINATSSSSPSYQPNNWATREQMVQIFGAGAIAKQVETMP